MRRWFLICFVLVFAVFVGGQAQALEKEELDTNDDGVIDQTFYYEDDKKVRREADKNFDGKIDQWDYYDHEEAYRSTAKDTNLDGKPDKWRYIEGPGVNLHEYDKNFDGKIDSRWLSQFMMDKRLKFPRHLYIWKEEDQDFDGVIDVYRVRGEKDPQPTRIGTPIDPNFKTIPEAVPEEEKTAKAEESAEGKTEKFIRERSEREDFLEEFREGI